MALGWRGQYSRYKEFFLNILILYKKRADLRMFMEIILTLTTIIVFSLFALKPTVLTIIALVKEVNEKEALIATLNAKIDSLQRARLTYDAQKENISLIQSAIPDSPSPDIYARQIEGLASKNSVNVLGISFGEATLVGKEGKEKPGLDTEPLPGGAKGISVSVSVSGAYQNLNTMIKDIENLRIPVKIDVLGINASDTETGRLIVSVLSGRMPYLKK